MRLLLLEDDATLGGGLKDFLQTEGHVVDWCQCVGAATLLVNEPYDALLVDWQLPDGSGLEWVRSLRRTGNAVPVVVMTARDLLRDRVQGLDSGADDYLVKPFDPEELSARIRAICRRAAGSASARRAFGDIEVDLSGKSAFVRNVRVDLTAREWSVLEALVLRAGRVVSRGDLESIVLGLDGDLASNALEVHISNIRRKLGKGFIQTERGFGYRLS